MATLMPGGKQQYFDDAGDPLVGGWLYTYAAGTDTPLSTYSDQAGTIPNANPIHLNARGEATVFWGAASYKVALHNALDVPIWTQDNVDAGLNSSPVTPTGSTTSKTLAELARAVYHAGDTLINLKGPPYNAKGDGVDDTAAVLAAVAAAVPGSTVFAPPGAYRILGTVPFDTEGVKFLAVGATFEQGSNNTPLFKVTAPYVVFDGIRAAGIGATDTASILSSALGGVNSRAYGVWVSGASHFIMRDCFLTLFRNSGVYVDDTVDDLHFVRVNVSGTYGGGTGQDTLGEDDGTYATMGFNLHQTTTPSNATGTRIFFEECTSTNSLHGYYQGPGYDYVTHDHSTAHSVGQHGAYIVPGSYLKFTSPDLVGRNNGLKLQTQGPTGLYTPRSVTITGGRIVGGTAPGLSITSVNPSNLFEVTGGTPARAAVRLIGLTVAGVDISASGAQAAQFAMVSAASIRDCTIHDSGTFGVQLIDFEGSFSGCTLNGIPYTPIQAWASAYRSADVADCSIHDVDGSSFLGTATAYIESTTIPFTPPAWAGTTLYAKGQYVTAGGNSYIAIIGGTSGGAGPSGTGLGIADGTVTWNYVSASPASFAHPITWQPGTFYGVDIYVNNGANLYHTAAGGTSAASTGPTGTGTGITDGTVTWDFVATLANVTIGEHRIRRLSVHPATSDVVTYAARFAGAPLTFEDCDFGGVALDLSLDATNVIVRSLGGNRGYRNWTAYPTTLVVHQGMGVRVWHSDHQPDGRDSAITFQAGDWVINRLATANGNPGFWTCTAGGVGGVATFQGWYPGIASATLSGIVTAGAQQIGGAKTFMATPNINSGGSTTISTGTGTVKMSTVNNGTNTAWIPIQYAGTTYYVPAWTTNAP